MRKKYELHIVSHTHWDREWYLTFQQFRLRLVRLIDRLLDMLDRDPHYRHFLLDGQTVILEDYLEIRPENRQRLEKHIKKGRIQIGPWYVQSDQFLVSGEALVRNLLIGHKISAEFGEAMRIGYLPDAFSQISQMPQVLRGFDIDNAVFSKGVGNELDPVKSEFIWRSPDGSKVLAILLAGEVGERGAYAIAKDMPVETTQALALMKEVKEKLASYATTPYLLVMNGVDHAEPQGELPGIIVEVNKRLKDGRLVHSTLEQYVRKVKACKPRLSVIRGEMRHGRIFPVCLGSWSTRMYLKQQNQECETILEKWAEPFSAFAWALGGEYPGKYLEESWKSLLKNHAHDSICGCSIDPVHEEMEMRFRCSKQMAEEVTALSLNHIAGMVNTSDMGDGDTAVAVFNPLNWERTEPVRSDVTFPSGTFAKSFELRDSNGKACVCHLVKSETTHRSEPGKPPAEVRKFEILFLAEKVPACGYKVYTLRPKKEAGKEAGDSMAAGARGMENEYLRVAAGRDGSLTVVDRRTGARFGSCNVFVDEADAGDEYDYSAPLKNSVISTRGMKAAVAVTEDTGVSAMLRIAWTMRLPASLTSDRRQRSRKTVACRITSCVRIAEGSQRLDIVTEVDNRAGDHRLRVLFDTGVESEFSYGDGQFGVNKRPVKPPSTRGWKDKPTGTHCCYSFVDLNDGRKGLAVACKGLPEYAVCGGRKRTVALTLLRCVGWLSRGDLLTRPYNCGPSIAAPGAQCRGRRIFEYAVIPHSGGWETAGVHRLAREHNVSLQAVQTGKHSGVLSRELSFITLEPAGLVLSTVKKSENGGSVIVRFYNIGDKAVNTTIRLWRPVKKARLVNLGERIVKKLTASPDGAVSLPVRGHEIKTLQLFL